MKRDQKAIEAAAPKLTEAALTCGAQLCELSPDDFAQTIVRSIGQIIGREPTRAELADALPPVADYYESLAAAVRRFATGPQLPIVSPPTKDEG